MWTCPKCSQSFVRNKQTHYCGDTSILEYLKKKSPFAQDLFNAFCNAMQARVNVEFKATKTMVAFVADKRFGYITQLGKNFLEFVLILDKPYPNNYCFIRITENKESKYYGHVCRLESIEDINSEIADYFSKAYGLAQVTK